MPELRFHVVWPDGSEDVCWSPSLVVHDHLEAGVTYPLDDFVGRARAALQEGSERVREKFGFACTASAAQLAQIEARAAALGDGEVTVLRLDPPSV